jgi:hypothetical protein
VRGLPRRGLFGSSGPTLLGAATALCDVDGHDGKFSFSKAGVEALEKLGVPDAVVGTGTAEDAGGKEG